MTGAELLAAALSGEGIATVFGLPGEEAMALIHALPGARVRFVPTHDQSAAAIMAATEGAIARRPGACLVSRGPGVTRLATGAATATADGFPLLAIVAGPRQGREHLPHQQHIDAAAILRPACKAVLTVREAVALPEVIRSAARTAYTGKPGAVAVIIPEDVASAKADAPLLAPHMPAPPPPDPQLVAQAAQLLDQAERPVILAGHAVVRAGAHEELKALAERADIPVVTTYMGKAAMEWACQRYCGSLGREAPDHADALLRQADVVLAAGYCAAEFAPANWQRGNTAVIHLGAEPAQVEAAYNPGLELVGCVRRGLAALSEQCRPRRRDDKLPHDVRASLEKEMEAAQRHGDTEPVVTPQRIVMALSRMLQEPDVLCVDVGSHQEWTCRLYPLKRPGTFWTSHSFAAMGFALPAAIGVAMGLERGHRCMAVMGDGGWLASAAEIETAVRLSLPITVLVLCDGAYGQQAAEAQARFGNADGARFGPVNVAALARSLGADAVQVTSSAELEQIFQPGPEQMVRVIGVAVDGQYNRSLTDAIPERVKA